MIVFNDPKKGANFCESFNRDIYHSENEELLYSGFGFVLFFFNDRRRRMGQVDLTEMYLAQGYLSSSTTYHPQL